MLWTDDQGISTARAMRAVVDDHLKVVKGPRVPLRMAWAQPSSFPAQPSCKSSGTLTAAGRSTRTGAGEARLALTRPRLFLLFVKLSERIILKCKNILLSFKVLCSCKIFIYTPYHTEAPEHKSGDEISHHWEGQNSVCKP